SRKYGISIRSGGHCAPLMHEAIGTVETGAVRFSFSYFTTASEVKYAADALKDIAKEFC
ncbi:MAG: aminotransferase class V-fold PLP-dependent enzyme, partial [Lachnospiraceae bacterium]|nr:aminotransferase class V-fold PLP-dependent enzyme [Lachnospiraceae bacterium]